MNTSLHSKLPNNPTNHSQDELADITTVGDFGTLGCVLPILNKLAWDIIQFMFVVAAMALHEKSSVMWHLPSPCHCRQGVQS